MHSLFDLDNPLMQGLEKLFDCIMLSVCWVLGSLPLITMGTACGALYRTVYRCIRRDEGNTLKTFWSSYRNNLKMGILVWLPVLAIYALLIADAVILKGLILQGQSMAYQYGIILLLIGVVSVWAAYCTAYCIRFQGGVKDVLWLSFLLVTSHPLTTFMILIFLLLGFALALLVPFLVLFLPALVCLAVSFPMEKVFLKHMQPKDAERVQNETLER